MRPRPLAVVAVREPRQRFGQVGKSAPTSVTFVRFKFNQPSEGINHYPIRRTVSDLLLSRTINRLISMGNPSCYLYLCSVVFVEALLWAELSLIAKMNFIVFDSYMQIKRIQSNVSRLQVSLDKRTYEAASY